MASTRNKNTIGNYTLDHKQSTDIESWRLYQNGANGYAYDTKLAGNGLNQGQIPWNKLSHNPADIESFLFGINSTNLIKPASKLTPEIKQLKSSNIYEKKHIIMPVPQAIPKNQRPFPI